jgi:hypothetical protein
MLRSWRFVLVLDNEIIDSFREEANGLLEELRIIIDKLEEAHETFPKELLEEFANKADRIMGTANTFDSMAPGNPVFLQIGKFGELCKVTGYKASTLNHLKLIPIFAAFWADTVDILQELCDNVGDALKIKEVTHGYIPTLQKRLIWLAQQILTITKGADHVEQSKINVDGLLRKLGFEV